MKPNTSKAAWGGMKGKNVLTYSKLAKLLQTGDVVYIIRNHKGKRMVRAVVVDEICDGWLETKVGILDFEDHGVVWWLTKKVALENV